MTRTESVCMSNTHASHQYPSRTQVTKPESNSSGTSVSSDVTLSSLKVVDAEKGLTCTVLLEVGINEWNFRVPGIVQDAWNLSCNTKIVHMITQIDEVLPIFVLGYSTIGKVYNFCG